ncbi:MAG TPA: hypothetical protein GXX51_07095 [Firmicutes bacterium]|nr:hypothetical protein [Bacillota bacterium]
MNCEKVSSLLSAYIDREVTADEERVIRFHLADCEECAREYEALKTTKNLAGSLPSLDIPPGFWSELRLKLQGETRPPRYNPVKVFSYPPLRVLVPLGIAAGLAAFSIIFPLLAISKPPQPGQQVLVDQYLKEHMAWDHTRPFSNDTALTYMLTSPRFGAPEAQLLSNGAMDLNSYAGSDRGAYNAGYSNIDSSNVDSNIDNIDNVMSTGDDLTNRGDNWIGDLMIGP